MAVNVVSKSVWTKGMGAVSAFWGKHEDCAAFFRLSIIFQ